jgi:hypothetical protein
MGTPRPPTPALLLIAATSRYAEALSWGRERAQVAFGRLAAVSESFSFVETQYYAAEMGADLNKQFWAFEQPIDPRRLAEIKLQTNGWEDEYAAAGRRPESRPLNLDPGYLTMAKLVLASTKDHAHRIYLADGIYAEVTLSFRSGKWQDFDWTYPDYRRDDFHRFFTGCRELLRNGGRLV